MRRKTTRAGKKVTADNSPASGRRSRRRKRSPSNSSDSADDADAVEPDPVGSPDTTTSNDVGECSSTSSATAQVWKVTERSPAKGGEIQKLKICLARPTFEVRGHSNNEKRRSTSKDGEDRDDCLLDMKPSPDLKHIEVERHADANKGKCKDIVTASNEHFAIKTATSPQNKEIAIIDDSLLVARHTDGVGDRSMQIEIAEQGLSDSRESLREGLRTITSNNAEITSKEIDNQVTKEPIVIMQDGEMENTVNSICNEVECENTEISHLKVLELKNEKTPETGILNTPQECDNLLFDETASMKHSICIEDTSKSDNSNNQDITVNLNQSFNSKLGTSKSTLHKSEDEAEEQSCETSKPKRSTIKLIRNNIKSSSSITESHTATASESLPWKLSDTWFTPIRIDLKSLESIYNSYSNGQVIDYPLDSDPSTINVLETSKENATTSSSKSGSLIHERSDTPPPHAYKDNKNNSGSIHDSSFDDGTTSEKENIIAQNRKISIVDDTASKLRPPPSPAKNPVSAILYITNLVRPFTLKQLQGLLERTGRIREDGFWTDRIKSKCYVQYETEEEAEATRNALHGVQWPIGNGKHLIIDYGTVEAMEAAKHPPALPALMEFQPQTTLKPQPMIAPKLGGDNIGELAPASSYPPIHEERKLISNHTNPEVDTIGSKGISEHGGINRMDDRKKMGAIAPVREWDLGKHASMDSGGREELGGKRRERSSDQSKRAHTKQRRSHTPNGDVVHKKRSRMTTEAPAQKLMDDLFLKTKSSPSIYWQALSKQEIEKKQQQRTVRMKEQRLRSDDRTRHNRYGDGGGSTSRRSGGSSRRRNDY